MTPPKRFWCSKDCVNRYEATQPGVIRSKVFARDVGVCSQCKLDTVAAGEAWNMDHVSPIWDDGDSFKIENLQTLCVACHKAKTKQEAGIRAKRASALKPH